MASASSDGGAVAVAAGGALNKADDSADVAAGAGDAPTSLAITADEPSPSASAPSPSPGIVGRRASSSPSSSEGKDATAAINTSAPAPPRWRFVNEAKKSRGYSSLHAGSYVGGRSSEELGAKYVAPDVSLYESADEDGRGDDVGRVRAYALPKRRSIDRDDTGVGKLAVSGVGKNVSDGSSPRDVGRLHLGGEDVEVEEYSGSFAGLARNDPSANGPRAPFKEWDVDLRLTPKPVREGEWFDGEVVDRYVSPEDETPTKDPRRVGRLAFGVPGTVEDDLVGEFRRREDDSLDRSTETGVPVARDRGGGAGDEGEVLDEGRRDGFPSLLGDIPEQGGDAPEGWHGDEEDEIEIEDDNCGHVNEEEPHVERAGSIDFPDEASSVQVADRAFDPDPTPDDDDDEKRKRRLKYCLMPLLFLLLAAAAIGAVAGREREGSDDIGTAVVGILAPPPPIVVAVNETTGPSSRPSQSPSRECPLGTKPFTIEYATRQRGVEHHQSEHHRPETSVNGRFATRGGERDDPKRRRGSVAAILTWRIKNACSGEVIALCLPCPDETTLPSLGDLSPSATECLPVDDEYAFEIVPAGDSSEAPCCGYNSISAITYDEIVMQKSVDDGNVTLFDDAEYAWTKIYFGEREVPCDSAAPSDRPSSQPAGRPSVRPSFMPSVVASADPSAAPSRMPSVYPSFPPSQVPSTSPSHRPTTLPSESPSSLPSTTPTTSPPTRSPLAFLGACPKTLVSFETYSIFDRIEADDVVYECIVESCRSHWYGLGSLTAALKGQGWVAVGSCSGTGAPTMSPTVSPTSGPTRYPSRRPSERPTRQPTRRPSGKPSDRPSRSPSHRPSRKPTNGPSFSPTLRPSYPPTTAEPTVQPSDRPTVTPACAEPEFNLCFAIDMSGSVCFDLRNCPNFEKVLEFSVDMVKEMDEQLEVEKSFSVVEFSTRGRLVSGLSSAAEIVPVIEGLDFTGGMTNHRDAIRLCQSSFSTSPPGRTNFVVPITDGVSTAPNGDTAAGLAEAEAESAKSAGTVIIPIFIAKVKNNEKEALQFMKKLSSDGKVFDVSDFDSLDTLREMLLDEVACGGKTGKDREWLV